MPVPGIAVRAAARALRDRLNAGKAITPGELVNAAFADADVEVRPVGRGHKFGSSVNARLERDAAIVWIVDDLDARDRAAVLGHELGHLKLHDDPVYEDRIAGRVASCDRVDVDGYSPRELKELQADAFAAEFLCPARDLRRSLSSWEGGIGALADQLGLPVRLVVDQMIMAMLDDAREPGDWRGEGLRGAEGGLTPDRVLFHGGKGVGKTTRLLGRAIAHVGRLGPASLMILTARDENATLLLRRMIGLHADGFGVWTGSVRALATEILAKWPDATRRSPAFRVVENGAATTVLERVLLETGGAGHYPAETARDLFRAFATERKAGTRLKEAPEPASDCMVAYEAALVEADCFDVPGLVPWAIQVLRVDPRAKAWIQDRFRHVIVDDFEDLTPAEIGLVRTILAGSALVAVAGDLGHPIRGYAGAASATVDDVATDLSLEPEALIKNLRSSDRVASALDAVGRLSGRGPSPARAGTPLPARAISHVDAVCARSEATALAARIRADEAAGIALRDQVVIARTHDKLRRTCSSLAARGIPVKYLGEVATRPEVLALLDWLRLAVDGDAAAFRRIASRLPYRLQGTSVARSGAILSAWNRPPEVRLREVAEWSASLRPGVPGLMTLTEHMSAAAGSWGCDLVLADWLLRSGTLKDTLARADDPAAGLELLGMHVALRMAGRERPAPGVTVPALIDRLRRAGAVDQAHAVLASVLEVASIDAVRAMTVHASAGREFEAVHVVGVDATAFPLRAIGARWPIRSEAGSGRHLDLAEVGVFEIALTRATKRTALYSARVDEARRSRSATPSPYLDAIADVLDAQVTSRTS